MNEFALEDIKWMQKCLELAKQAFDSQEVPVGCVIIKDGALVSEAYNLKETEQCPLSHAEINAIEKACKKLGRWRLSDCTLYVSLEPCIMCAGAIQQARIKRVVYATNDPKGGALGSLYSIHEDRRLNHRMIVTSDVLQEESAKLLRDFFKERREN